MKAFIGRRHRDYVLLTQMDPLERRWTTTRLPIVRTTLERSTLQVIVDLLAVGIPVALLAFVIFQFINAIP